MKTFQYCFRWEKHFYMIYKTYNHEFSIEYFWPLKIYIHIIFVMIYLQIKCFRMFPTFCYNFNSLHYARKKSYIYNDNLLWLCRILALKWAQEHWNTLIISKLSYVKFKITLKFGLFFAITSSKFNKMTSFWTNFNDNFDGFHIIESTNFITHKIEIKII